MRGPSPLYIEERHRALGRDATFSWSRALTHPPRCNRTRHRGRHLDFVGAAILVSWGPPSWTGSRGGRHLGSDVVTSLTLNRRLYYSYNHLIPCCLWVSSSILMSLSSANRWGSKWLTAPDRPFKKAKNKREP